ncbi:protein Bzz1p [Trichomonascus vanleenenianus]|uniref:Bzz1p n=1 Tax=Trichomonascus vanleenenianus TaxID=2268995 RepID=UPI003ECA105D
MSGPIQVSIGDELKDGYKPTDNWVSNGIKFMDDVTSFYRERATIEKEYASKLTALTAKYFEKKAKVSTNMSVGDHPKVTPGSLENASLVAWTEILNETEQMGKERQRLANELSLQVADQVHGVGLRFEELRKRYGQYNEKLIEDRDNYYGELKKAKGAYDSACQTMESQRMKASKSFDKSKEKASRKMEQKEGDMNNHKNVYLIKLNVANRLKEKYYHEDVPELLDGLQQLNEARVTMLNGLWKQAVQLEKACLKKCDSELDAMTGIVEQNKPSLDSAMFVKHNMEQWTEPADFHYEPSSIWHDDEKMITNDQALQFLHQMLHEANTRLHDQTAATQQKFDTLKAILEEKKTIDPALKSNAYMQLIGKHLSALQTLTTFDTARLVQQVEVETIEVAANGRDLSSLPLPQVKKRGGLFGKLRHKKTLPAATTNTTNGNGGDDHSSHHSLERTSTRVSMASSHHSSGNVSAVGAGHHATSFLSSLVGRRKSKKVVTPAKPTAKALYAYTAQGDDELSLSEGQQMTVLEPDDGSGWVSAQIGSQTGLVPAAYIEMSPGSFAGENSTAGAGGNAASKKKGPAVAPKRGAKRVKYMIALYDYDAQGADELTIRAGDKIAVVTEDQGDGWTEGELNAMSGVFPTTYAKPA